MRDTFIANKKSSKGMAFELNRDQINDRLSQLLERLITIAKADDVISSDEQELIGIIRNHIKSFENKFVEMAENHSEMEMVTKAVKTTFEEAIEAAARQARKDGTITADELVLIDRLAKTLRNEDISSYLK